MTDRHTYVVDQVSGDLESRFWNSRSDGASQQAWGHQRRGHTAVCKHRTTVAHVTWGCMKFPRRRDDFPNRQKASEYKGLGC